MDWALFTIALLFVAVFGIWGRILYQASKGN